MSGKACIGTSGFMYDDWRGVFYPQDLAKKKWLEFYAYNFDTVEMNNTYYAMPRAHVCENWRQRTGEQFSFTVKLNRQITHRQKLLHYEKPLQMFMDAVESLEKKLATILVQLPPRFKCDPARLENFLQGCPSSRLWAVEFRDPAWLNDEVYAVLKKFNAALVIHDLIPDHPRVFTADWTYYRFHGPQGEENAKYAGDYPPAMLRTAAKHIRANLKDGLDVYAYFNNDIHGYAVKNAMELRKFVTKK